MSHKAQVAAWAYEGALAVVGDDPLPSMETVAAVMAAKREIALAGAEICDLAMDVVGGAVVLQGLAARAGLPRHPRRQVPPLNPEATLRHAGRLALGVPCDEV